MIELVAQDLCKQPELHRAHDSFAVFKHESTIGIKHTWMFGHYAEIINCCFRATGQHGKAGKRSHAQLGST